MKIGIISTSRADLGIYTPLIKKLAQDSNLKLKIYLGGSHHVEDINQAISSLGDMDVVVLGQSFSEITTFTEMAHGMANTLSTMTKTIGEQTPDDAYIVLGDRFEMFACAISVSSLKLTLIHIHGGEVTYGAIDDKFRHSITQLADFHLVSCEKYRSRVIRMGQAPERVLNIGSLSICDLENFPFKSKQELTSLTGLDFDKQVALVTYHPETINSQGVRKEIKNLLSALESSNLQLLITGVNNDPGNNTVKQELDSFISNYSNKVYYTQSLGRANYFSACKYASIMIGNSSSGIIEAASFKLPVVNIGLRQQGREQSNNIVNTSSQVESIQCSIDTALKIDKSDIRNIYSMSGGLTKAHAFIVQQLPRLIDQPRTFHEEQND
tara:strand:- start:10805 stop:11950 length:1146 start_codon:yes stop_codon:yes gene_type:complete